MKNIWKASTLVLAGALALVVGNNVMISEADAAASPNLISAQSHLESARTQLNGAPASANKDKALKAITEATSAVGAAIKEANAAPPPKQGSQAPAGPKTGRVANPK